MARDIQTQHAAETWLSSGTAWDGGAHAQVQMLRHAMDGFLAFTLTQRAAMRPSGTNGLG